MTTSSGSFRRGGPARAARRHTSLIIVIIAISLIAALVFAAVSADGREVSRASSNDGGAWLINRELAVVGHKNRAAGELSSFIRIPDTPQADVHQAGDLVVVHDPSTRQLIEVDTRAFNPDLEPTVLPEFTQVHAVENAIIVSRTDPLSIWNVGSLQLTTLQDLATVRPQFTAEGAGTIAVRPDGTLVVLEHDTMTLTWFAPDGTSSAPIATGIDPDSGDTGSGEVVDVTIVDDTAVILLANGDLILVGAADVDTQLGWADLNTNYPQLARLQQPSGMNDPLVEAPATRVAGVTATGELLSIDVDESGGTVTLRGALGGMDPLAPIAFEDCVYGVVTSPPTLGIACSEFSSRELQGAGSELRLRLVNGYVWVNDLDDGGTWVTNDSLRIEALNDWSRAAPTQQDEPLLEDDGGEAPNSPDTVIVDDPNALGSVEDSDDYNPTEENMAPIAVDDSARTRVDRAVVIDVLANDTDLNNDILIVSAVEVTAGDALVTATASLQEVQVTPGAGFLGAVQFTYWVSDGRAEPVPASVVVDVLSNDSANRPPEPVTDVVATAPGNATTIDVLRNDSDPDGDALALTLITTDTGTLRWDPSGQVTFTPDTTTAAGWIELPYIVSDDLGAEAGGVLRVEIRDRGANQEPDARNDQAATVASRPVAIDLLENDSDPDGDPLLVSSRPRLLSSPNDAEARTSTTPDGEFIFEADEPGVYLFEYSINDGAEGGSESDTARIRVDVSASLENSPPIAVRDDVVLAIGDTRTVYVLDNDGDPDGDVISIVDWSASPGLLIAEFTDGTGHIGFQITASPTARRPTFSYSISDGVNDPVSAAVVVSLVGQGTLDQPPFALDDLVEVRAGSTVQRAEVLANDFDPEGGSLRIVSTGDIADAQVTIASDGQSLAIAVPVGAFTSFTVPYDIEDEGGNRAAAVLRVQLIARDAPNRPPTARADQARTRAGQAIRIDVMRNDSDPDADAIALEGVVDQPENGTAAVTADGVIQYRPDPGFTGTDIFQYAIVDAVGDRALGEVFVGVIDQLGVNLPPIANDDSYVLAGTPNTTPLEVRANDFDPEGDPLRVVEVTSANVGSVAIDLFGRVEYIPPTRLDEATVVTFDYVISDTAGNRARASVTIELEAFEERIPPTPVPIIDTQPTPEPTPTPDPLEIEPTPTPVPTPDIQVENEPPIAVNDERGPVQVGSTVRVSVLDNDFDPDGTSDALQIVDVGGGVGVLISGSEVVFQNIRETTQVSYTIADEFGAEASAVITVVVIANQAPVVQPRAIETAYETAISVELGGQATDADGDTLFFICCEDRRNGEVTEVQTTENQLSLLFTPASGFVGQAAFSYRVDDQQGHQTSGVVTVTVLAPDNRPPIVFDNTVQVPQGVSVSVDLIQLSSDPDGDFLTRSLLTAPGDGIDVTIDGGTALVTVDRNTAVGPAGAFTYLVSDGVLDTEGSVSIDIIQGANEAPLVGDAEIDVPAASSATVDLATLTTETDPGDSVVWTLDGASFDPIIVDLTGSFVQIVAPASSVNSEHLIAFTATDTRGATGSGTISVTVVGPTEPEPAAMPDTAIANRGERVIIDALGNDVDPLGLGLTLRVVEPSFGTATISNNQVSFSPGNEVGAATITYTMSDAAGREATTTIEIDTVGVPDQPAPPGVNPDSNQVTVSWTNPAPNGRPVTGYLITADTGEVNEVGVQNSFVWDQLTNGQEYTFTVTAINAIGSSDASESSLPATPNQVPEQPSPPTTVFDDRQLSVTWTAPDNAGTEITGYEIEIGPSSAIEQIGTDTTFVWQGLTNGQDYTFRIRAQNDAGFSPFSALSAPEHPSAKPEPPTIGATERGTLGGSLITHWFKPVDNGDEIIEYEVRASTGERNRVTGADTLSLVWSDLTTGTDISFEVRARNRSDWSDWSTPSIGIPACRVPSAPENVNAVRGDGLVVLTWDEAVANGCQVTGYTITTDGGAIQNSATPGHTFTGLVNGDDYFFTIRATNERGVSVSSDPSNTVRPAGKPLCTAGNSLTATVSAEESVDLTWSNAIDNGEPILEYLIDSGTGPVSLTGNSWTVTNLADGTEYSFIVTARNVVGTSVVCGSASIFTWAVPTDVFVTLSFDRETAIVTATAIGGLTVDSAPRLGYTWEMDGPGGNDSNGEYPFPTGQAHNQTYDFVVTEDGDYDVSIEGCNAAGCKSATARIEVTLAAEPDAMDLDDIVMSDAAMRLSASGELGTALFVEFFPPEDNGAAIIEYQWEARRYFGPGPRFGSRVSAGTEPAAAAGGTYIRFDHLAGYSDFYDGVNGGELATWRIRVRATNSEGRADDWSPWAEHTPLRPAATIGGTRLSACGTDQSCVVLNLTGYGFGYNDSYNVIIDGGRSADCDNISSGPGGEISVNGLECDFEGSTPAPSSFGIVVDTVTGNVN